MADITPPPMPTYIDPVRRFRINTENEATARQTFVAGMQACGFNVSALVADTTGNAQNDVMLPSGITVHWLGKQPGTITPPTNSASQPTVTPYAGMHIDVLDAERLIDLSKFSNTDEVLPTKPFHAFL